MKPKRRKGIDGLYCAAELNGTVHPFSRPGETKSCEYNSGRNSGS